MSYEVKVYYDDYTQPSRPHYVLEVYINGILNLKEEDDMAPEDAIFVRDLAWIKPALEEAYNLGFDYGKQHEG